MLDAIQMQPGLPDHEQRTLFYHPTGAAVG